MILLKLLFLLISIQCLVKADVRFSKIINTRDGPVQGLIVRTVLRQMEYSSFRGIPYAEPPVGQLRFKPPVKFTRKDATKRLSAFQDANACAQFENNQVIGNEDCLYLNVYTPEVEFKDRFEKKAVIVWIHGGAFMWNSNNSTKFGPDYLIEKDVVVVSINYRLGAFGFMVAGDYVSGNMGLKDQVMALQWVRDNIANFGGDPNKVTIFGESAGAVSVELHRLSELSRGLFRASIAMSGSPLNIWGFSTKEDAQYVTELLVRKWKSSLTAFDTLVNTYINSPPSLEEIKTFMKEATTAQIATGTAEIIPIVQSIPFEPTIESASVPGAFITKMPEILYKKKQFSTVPHIIGYTSDEFVGIADMYKVLYKLPSMFVTASESVISQKCFYDGIDKTLHYIMRNKEVTVWKYENSFDYPQSLHKQEKEFSNVNGCGHADDVAHVFYMQGKNQPLDFHSDFAHHRERIVTLWTNLAKYLNVTAVTSNIGNIYWPPATKNGYYLELDRVPKSISLSRNMWEEYVDDYIDDM